MKTLLIALIALSLTTCKKEDETINGLYVVTGHNHAGTTYAGTIEIKQTTMNVNAGITLNEVKILQSGRYIDVIPLQADVNSGNGQVNGDQLTISIKPKVGGTYTFTGSK